MYRESCYYCTGILATIRGCLLLFGDSCRCTGILATVQGFLLLYGDSCYCTGILAAVRGFLLLYGDSCCWTRGFLLLYRESCCCTGNLATVRGCLLLYGESCYCTGIGATVRDSCYVLYGDSYLCTEIFMFILIRLFIQKCIINFLYSNGWMQYTKKYYFRTTYTLKLSAPFNFCYLYSLLYFLQT